MPRSRSWSSESSTRSTSLVAANTPDWRSIASTSVVFPWSTWAMIGDVADVGALCTAGVEASRVQLGGRGTSLVSCG